MSHPKIRRTLRHLSVAGAATVFVFCLSATERVTWWLPVAMILSAGWLILYTWANRPERKKEL